MEEALFAVDAKSLDEFSWSLAVLARETWLPTQQLETGQPASEIELVSGSLRQAVDLGLKGLSL